MREARARNLNSFLLKGLPPRCDAHRHHLAVVFDWSIDQMRSIHQANHELRRPTAAMHLVV